jgi:hypothetical protein
MTYNWEYHLTSSKKGRGLRLLSSNEVDLFWLHFERFFEDNVLVEKYKPFVNSINIEQDLFLLNRFKSVGSKLSALELASLNLQVNKFFTDEGWRSMRKSINRDLGVIKKRKEQELRALDEDLSIPTEWHYSENKPTRGKRLKLLSHAELGLCLPILIAMLSEEKTTKDPVYRGHLSKPENYIDRGLISSRLKRHLIKILTKIEKEGRISNTELLLINTDCNGLFSDLGWKKFRAKLAQKKRRTDKSLVELTSDTVNRLVTLKTVNSFESLDDAIGYLFDETETNPELEKLHCIMDAKGFSTYQDVIDLISKLQ